MKLGDIDLLRTKEGWLASVFISSEIDKSGFTFMVGPAVTLPELFREVGVVTETLIGFDPPGKKLKLSGHTLSRGSVGFDSSKMFLTVPKDDV